MEQKDYLQGSYTEPSSVPQGINVLTILSFIGSGFQIISGFFSYWIIPFSVQSVNETRALEKTREMKPFSGFLKWSVDATLRQYELRMPVLLVTIATALICIWGALQMRKRKKAGFAIYTAGEIALPLFTALAIDAWSSIFGFIIAIVFILLFWFQRKHLTA
ncbi:hypothetical protein IQ13_4101 [Lacibacter cauensis]|uniref:Uncharacterized protein n=1 Tax=Lacibacter cauensis TaxID=510947 RepID=A0A562SAR3_9BACT|nr:hypothetical protein [Lacibacter cauensis]TWI78415.1 hypothetical protein IQ13_4101 [Lacibacter cauensis]